MNAYYIFLNHARGGDWLNSFVYLIVLGVESSSNTYIHSILRKWIAFIYWGRYSHNPFSLLKRIHAASENTRHRTIYYIISINVSFGWKGFLFFFLFFENRQKYVYTFKKNTIFYNPPVSSAENRVSEIK